MDPYPGYEALVVGRRGSVGWLLFDRPDVRNAMDSTMLGELERAWAQLDADPDVRAIVSSGSGRDFQTGVDVVQLAQDRESLRRWSRQTRDATLRFTAWQCGVSKPVLAAVNGLCAGGGLHFVADADVVLMASDAELCDPHVSLGQVSAYETIALAKKAPVEPIMRMALAGRHERMGARRALQLGICSEVVDPPERLLDRAQELGETLAAIPGEALTGAKRQIWATLEGDHDVQGPTPPAEPLLLRDQPRQETG